MRISRKQLSLLLTAAVIVFTLILAARKVPMARTDSVFRDVPKEVFYVWCGYGRMFEYRHYLSVRSVFLHLNPYRVRLFYEYKPLTQKRAYNTWLTELRHDYAFFSIETLPENLCEDKERMIDDYLSQHGGIFVHEEVILAGPLNDRWFFFDSLKILEDKASDMLLQISKPHKSFSIDLNRKTSVSIASMPVKAIRGETRLEDSRITSVTVKTISSDNTPFSEDEVVLFRASVSVIPEHIWELDSEAGRLLRTAAYGKSDLAKPMPDFSNFAPNIAHVVWANNDAMSFAFYLCILSLLEVAKVDKVFIHGDGPPTGMYWNMIRNHSRLQLVHRTLINGDTERVFGNEVENRAHVSDVLRVDIMLRYGGLYVDTDAIFFRPLTRELRAYDAVVSYDISAEDSRGFPEKYQNGIMLGKPGAKFWRLHLESMREYYDNDWLWNSCFSMYKIKERHPKTLLNEPRLNTICHDYNCYPHWEPHLVLASEEQIAKSLQQWRNSTFALHHTHPDLPEYGSPEALLKNNGTTLFGEVGLYVLEQSGKLECFRNRGTCQI